MSAPSDRLRAGPSEPAAASPVLREDVPAISTLGAILLAAFTLRFVVATVFPTGIWPDEIFESLEQAHRLVWGNGIVPWEFRIGVRSWLLPGFLAAVMRLSAGFGPGSTGYLGGVRFVLSLLSLSMPASTFLLARRRFGLRGAFVAAFAVSLWFELVYFAPKALNEVVAAGVLVPGIAILEDATARTKRRRLFSAGVLLGLAVALRMQLAPAVVVAAAWSLRRGERGWLLPIVVGMGFSVLFAGLVDFATWGRPFQSYWLNFYMNVFQGKMTRYGTSPWYAYFEVFAHVWSWSALIVIPLAALGARSAPIFAVSAGVSLATHLVVSHKEYRFLFPTVALVLVLAGLGLAEVHRFAERRWVRSPRSIRLLLAATVAAWALVSGARAARYDWLATSLVGPSGQPPFMWRHLRGSLLAFEKLSTDDTVCGVGLENRHWVSTGGYAYLHRDVPIFEITNDEAYARYQRAFNAMIVRPGAPDVLGAFRRGECQDEVCIYRREGPCAPIPDYSLNQILINEGR